jgi:antitoxin VapB
MKTAKLFLNGNSQAVRLPKEYRFRGDEVVIKRMGNAVVLLPKDDPWKIMSPSLVSSQKCRKGNPSCENSVGYGHLHLCD